ncbi:phosphotransferase [uncultured Arthrobacter sp.]|uniref:phosphotransferase n=1 Tax=uncultured Arthrobacter sp. TaxID=114050 RepID=UPI0025D332A4|nr:phosphotransferase [uncultured Arthrobacter sp.]
MTGTTVPAVAPLPFLPMQPEDAVRVLESVFGIEVSEPPARLATERDDTFRVSSRSGDFVLKVAHPDDDRSSIDLQTAALRHASEKDPELPLQRVVPTAAGNWSPAITGKDGQQRVARLLTFLPGSMLRTNKPTPGQLRQCGIVEARLALALADFDHPADGRYMMFDLRHFNDLRAIHPPQSGQLIARVFDWFDEVLSPVAHELPVQVLHMDFGLDNVLVDPGTPEYVCGVLDWGDAVRTWRAADLASGLASQAGVAGPAWQKPAHIIAGYISVNPLTPLEHRMLPGLVAMRIAQRILLAEKLSASLTNNTDYLRRNLELSYQQLRNLDF